MDAIRDPMGLGLPSKYANVVSIDNASQQVGAAGVELLSVLPVAAIRAARLAESLNANETFYRSMSRANYEQLVQTGKLPATAETFISPTQAFAADYRGVLVEFNLQAGATDALRSVGVRDTSVLAGQLYGDLPLVQRGWASSNAFFKAEGAQVNIGLGQGGALDIFNANILNFRVVPR
jgi:hypothetical protein